MLPTFMSHGDKTAELKWESNLFDFEAYFCVSQACCLDQEVSRIIYDSFCFSQNE